MTSSSERKIPDSYEDGYYEANEQDGDRIALRWYTALVRRYADSGRVLDFGCGTGWLVRRLAAGGSADGLEQSEYGLSEARKNNTSSQFYSSIGEVPSSMYAALTCIHVVEHVEEPELAELMSEWKRVLKPGGVVLVVTPDLSGRGAQIRGSEWRGYDDPTHITLRGHEYWKKLLTDADFEILAEGSDGLWDPPYGFWFIDRARLVPIAAQVFAGRLLKQPGSGESAVLVAKLK